jgi:FKBP12-rapamycin complex-associated protein
MDHANSSSLDAEVRLSVFQSLDESFDSYLAQYESLSALFVGLNDEDYEIRELTVCVVGRLSSRNPAYIMPSLRKTLIQVRRLHFVQFSFLIQYSR